VDAVALGAAREPLVLALDVGTSSVRALVYDAAGQVVEGAHTQAPYALRTTADGGVEVDAAALVERTLGLLDALAARAPAALGAVRAVGTSAFWHSVVGVDAAGRAITPLLLWADARAHAAAQALQATLDERAVHARTGCVLHWSYLPAKLRWLADTQPTVARRVRRWLSFGEYLYWRLFGEARCSLSMASATGLFDQHTRTWDPAVLAAVPVDAARLAPLGDAPLVGLRRAYAARWPTLAALPWYPAHGDGACSNVGAGCVDADRWALMVGTSGALRVAWAAADVRIPWGAWCYRVDAERFVLGGALNDGGNLYAWLRETLRLPLSTADDGGAGAAGGAGGVRGAATLEAALAALAPDTHGLTVLPFLAGERSPGWAPVARGAIVGLTLATRPLDLLRAGLEAVALRFALLAGIMAEVAPPPRQIVATGGALLRSPVWTQIVADALGHPLVASGEPEASSRGVALLALVALGALPDLAAAPARLGAVYSPDAARHATYQAALARQQALYARLVAG
jgi:gluconokinase